MKTAALIKLPYAGILPHLLIFVSSLSGIWNTAWNVGSKAWRVPLTAHYISWKIKLKGQIQNKKNPDRGYTSFILYLSFEELSKYNVCGIIPSSHARIQVTQSHWHISATTLLLFGWCKGGHARVKNQLYCARSCEKFGANFLSAWPQIVECSHPITCFIEVLINPSPTLQQHSRANFQEPPAANVSST